MTQGACLELHRQPSRAWRPKVVARAVPVAFGLAVAVSSGTGLITQPLDRDGRISGVGLLVVGLLMAVLRFRPLRATWYAARARPLLMTLDDAGVRVRHGSLHGPDRWALLSWADVVAVRVARLDDPAAERPWRHGPLQAVVVEPREDACVRGEPDAYDVGKARFLGLSPTRAMLSLILDRTSAERPDQVLAWLREHRPDVQVDDRRSG